MTAEHSEFHATRQSGWALGIPLTIARWLLGAVLVCTLAGLLSVALGPDNNWDLRYYHLYAPWAYLNHRYLYDIAPAQYQGFLNPTADFLFYGLLSLINGYPRWIAFIMGAVHGLNAVLVAAIAWHSFGPDRDWRRVALAGIATVIGITGAGAAPLLGTTTNDLINSIFVLAAVLLALKAAEAARPLSLLGWCGLAAGAGMGLKLTAAIFLPGLAVVAALIAWRRRSIGGLAAFGGGVVLAFVAIAGHHMLTLWRDFGNPAFPLLNDIFQSPYYDAVSIRDDQFLPRGAWQLLAYPLYWTQTTIYLVLEMSFRDWRAAMAYVAIIVAIVVAVVRASGTSSRHAAPQVRGVSLLFAFLIVSYLVWALAFGNYRYAVTLEMLTGIAILAAIVATLRDHGLSLGVAAAALVVVLATTVYPDWGRRNYDGRYVDVEVPPLPSRSVVLVATDEPAAYFIPFAEPSAQYLGIENNFLLLSQDNRMVRAISALMRAPGRAKFIVSEGGFDAEHLNAILTHFGLKLAASPCRPIRSNFPGEELALCEATETAAQP